MRRVFLIFFIGWLLSISKYLTIMPLMDFEEHEVTGIEFKLTWRF